MNYVPILVMDSLLIIITILLLIADKLLVSYGECKVSVLEGDEVKEFTIDGGISLLNALNENGFEVSNSCGGKGSCGYCKVQVPIGGGLILPTEEIWMSRQEKLNDMRLACQVKVKNDITIKIPDFLTVVHQMVLNKNFDANKKWFVKIQ
ncbi:MAG: 2Fe-2S iron-sulfur cluster binding domain-containing protein [Spirochaetaceae bacterium]|nr:2Fe-2S iron-sulfur cluster binding domain-containing protein [Spirochaetaceae bacterium]